jgi:MGT family glycosyltransferase
MYTELLHEFSWFSFLITSPFYKREVECDMRYLFCTMASHGYVYPAIGLAKQLVERGHQVKFVTGQDFAAILEQHGLARLPRGENDGPSFEVPQWGNNGEVLRQVQHTAYACRSYEPDVLIASQLALGPLIFARASGRPVAVFGFGTYLWPKRHIEESQQSNLDRERALMHARTIEVYHKAYTRINGPLLQSDIPCDSHYQQSPLLADLYLLRSVPELEIEADWLPPKVKFVGDCLWEPDVQTDPDLIDVLQHAKASNHKIVYVQYQAAPLIPDYWPNLVKALQGQSVQVVAATGKHQLDTNDLPSNFFLRPYIAHQSILPHADVVMTAGTSSSMLGALSHGIPLLLVPYTSENPEVAIRCERAGVAISLPPFNRYTGEPQPENITPEALKDALSRLLYESSASQNTQRIKRSFDELRKKRVAVDLLERMVRKEPSFGLRMQSMAVLTS